MTVDYKARIVSEFDRIKPTLEKLSQYLKVILLSALVREDFEHFMYRVKDVDRDRDESQGLGDIFVGLPDYFQDVSQDINRALEGLALSEPERRDILHHIRSIEERFQTIKGLIWEWNLPGLHTHFDYLWTTEKDDWWLIEVESPDGSIGYDIEQISKQMSLLIEDNEAYFYVIERMKEAGNRRVTLQEYAALFPIDLSEGLTFAPPAQASNSLNPSEPDNTEH